jgi:regulation of enolase protein 1 (concanavalin A-like superfamily)
MFKAAGDFMFSTKVDVNSHVTYDAGCIALYGTGSLWAKLCLERQGEGRLDVISVVTHGKSDDATSFPAAGTSIYLKVAKADGAIFFYASEDGKAWTIIRKFNLESKGGLWAGFSAQSPDGNGASASFADFRYLPGKVNIWKLN